MCKVLIYLLVLFAIFLEPCLCLVSGHGEECNYTEECHDHRMVCKADEYNVTRCECDRFHEWKGTATGCKQLYDIKTILNMTLTSTDNKGNLERDQTNIFIGQKVAGLFVMSMALLCPLAVAIHCCHIRRKDRILKKELREIKQRVEEAKLLPRNRGDGGV